MFASLGSSFLRQLHRDLRAELEPEMVMTMRVAVLTAAGVPRQQIAGRLSVDEVDIRACLSRLRRVAERWNDSPEAAA